MLKLRDVNTYGVHDGLFHADDVFSGALIAICNPDVECVRSRNEEELAKCDLLIDVGNGEFDHHKNPKQIHEGTFIPYCGFGLLWRVYAEEVIDAIIPGISRDETLRIKQEIDRDIITYIDGMDNGYNMVNTRPGNGNLITIPLIINLYNRLRDVAQEDVQYLKAREFAIDYLVNCINLHYQHSNQKSTSNQWLDNSIQSAYNILVGEYPKVQAFDCSSTFNIQEAMDEIVEIVLEKFNPTEEIIRRCSDTVLQKLTSSVLYHDTKFYKEEHILDKYEIKTVDKVLSELEDSKYSTEFIENFILKELQLLQHADIVIKAYNEALKNNVNYIYLECQVPYLETLKDLDADNSINFAIYKQTEDRYCIQGVPSSFSRFDAALAFPDSWAGLSNEQLASVSRNSDLTFCHTSRTFLVSKTLEGILDALGFTERIA